jgi:uncharacterized membrane protein YhaH (DUF805 family)
LGDRKNGKEFKAMNPIKGYCNYMMRVGRMNERMTRKEFWPYFIFNWGVLYVLDKVLKPLAVNGGGLLLNIVCFVLMFYTFGPMIQRVNDAYLRKRFLLVLIVPYVGPAIVLLMLLRKSYPETTEYGPCRG